ncbi:unnamed protein product [Rhizophagus irregularis]|nr:unnamed protein product [Rhizophagus irregularis]
MILRVSHDTAVISVPLNVAFRRFCPSYIWTRGHSTVFVFHLTREFSVFFLGTLRIFGSRSFEFLGFGH